MRQINNNPLQIIAEFVGLEVSLRTIVKINSNLKNVVKQLYIKQIENLFGYKKILIKYDDSHVKEILFFINYLKIKMKIGSSLIN